MYDSSIRIYLKKCAEDFIREGEGGKNQKSFYGYQVREDQDGALYVSPANFTDPTIPLPKISPMLIAKVTFLGGLSQNSLFRNEGVYRFGRAVMSLQNSINPNTTPPLGYQAIRIVAPGMTSLRQIYTKVRQGKLEPSEDWGTAPNASS